MDKRIFYLSERVYNNSGKENEKNSFEKEAYWEEIVGKNIWNYLLKNNDKIMPFLRAEDFVVKSSGISSELYKWLVKDRESEASSYYFSLIKVKVFFPEFYCKILEYSNGQLKGNLQSFSDCFIDTIYDDFTVHLVLQLQTICVRTLILKMHLYKQEGKLKGGSPEEEYTFFCNRYLGHKEFYIELFDEYPVLYRCIQERHIQLEKFYIEVIEHFRQDKMQIQKSLTQYKSINKITGINGNFSDLHNDGKQVLRVEIDYTEEVLYKPHSMENEKFFYELLEWLSNKIGVKQYGYSFISKSSYSWSAILKYETCKKKEQINTYYQRIGVQLFLVYLLGTKDLHYENIIAVGEYPVLIDLEVLISATKKVDQKTATQEVCDQLLSSVLYTGMLPFYYWNKDGNGVDGSAINGTGGQQYPFRMPVIVNGKTSKMKIEYQYLKSKYSQNKARYNDRFEESYIYKKEIIEGFTKAYEQALTDKLEIRNWLRKLRKLRSRVLISDTQRYSMLLSSSYHPSLLRDGADREIFLNSIRNVETSQDRKILEVEIKSLLKGDIPFFYCILNQNKIYSRRNVILDNYYVQNPAEEVIVKLDKLNISDMEKQTEYISTALDLSSNNEERYQNGGYHVSQKLSEDGQVDDNEKYILDDLIERLLRDVIWNSNRTEISWPTIQISFSTNVSWSMRAMNYYLYDGLAGMLLLFHKLRRKNKNIRFDQIYLTLKKMLFSYTMQGIRSLENLWTRKTGAYDGESSIAYVYLLLYKQDYEEEYLQHAEKHMAIVRKLIHEDTHYDLLSGNAGAAYIFIILYQITKKEKYIEDAEQCFSILRRMAEKMPCGIGWIVEKRVPPMAGMAHGNSGFLISAVALWKYTGKRQYEELAYQIMKYENSLYDIKRKNWKDMRSVSSIEETADVEPVAWCHGAAGILLSRIRCYEMVEDEIWKKRLEKDMLRAYCKLKEFWKRDSYTLCHGILGNLWILKIAEIELERYGILLDDGTQKKLEINHIKLLPQERVNPGFMNGYGGIIYALLE